MADNSWIKNIAEKLNNASGIEPAKDFGTLATFDYGLFKKEPTHFKVSLLNIRGGNTFEKFAGQYMKSLKGHYMLNLSMVRERDGMSMSANCYYGKDLNPKRLKQFVDELKSLEKQAMRRPIQRTVLNGISDTLMGTLLAQKKAYQFSPYSEWPDLNISLRTRRSKQKLTAYITFLNRALQSDGDQSTWFIPWDVLLLLECCLEEWPETTRLHNSL